MAEVSHTHEIAAELSVLVAFVVKFCLGSSHLELTSVVFVTLLETFHQPSLVSRYGKVKCVYQSTAYQKEHLIFESTVLNQNNRSKVNKSSRVKHIS